MTDQVEQPLSLVLFSGTEDRLQAAAVLTAGAAALGRPVHIFLQYWALDAFRADRIGQPQPLAPEAGQRAKRRSSGCARRVSSHGPRRCAWPRRSARSTSRPARCRWICCNIEADQLDSLVDGVEGVTAFFVTAGEGQVVFI